MAVITMCKCVLCISYILSLVRVAFCLCKLGCCIGLYRGGVNLRQCLLVFWLRMFMHHCRPVARKLSVRKGNGDGLSPAACGMCYSGLWGQGQTFSRPRPRSGTVFEDHVCGGPS